MYCVVLCKGPMNHQNKLPLQVPMMGDNLLHLGPEPKLSVEILIGTE